MRTKFFALEDNTDAGDVELVPETQAEVEAGAAEVDTRAREIDDEVDAVEDAVDGAETLGDIQDAAQDSVDEGTGLDETAARITEAAVESIRDRLGLPSRRRVVPAIESFGSSNSRVAATKIVIEGIGDWLKKIWEGIKSACRRLLDKIKSFFLGVVKSNDSLGKLLEDLEQRIRNLPSEVKVDSKTLKSESLARALSVNKKASKTTAIELLTNGVQLLEASQNIAKSIEVAASQATQLYKEDVGKTDYDSFATDVRTKVTAASRTLGAYVPKNKVVTKPSSDTNVDIMWFGPYGGSKVLVFEIITKFDAATKTPGTFKMYFEYQDDIEASEIDALERNELTDVLKKAYELLDFKKTFDKNQKAAEATFQAGEKLANEVLKSATSRAEGSNRDESARLLRDLQRDVSAYNATAKSLSVNSSAIAYSTVKSAADYISASIYNLKKK